MSKNLRERLGSIDPFNAQFVASVKEDERLVPYDIRGSIAHAKMLAAQRLISTSEAAAIISGLEHILAEWRKGTFTLNPAFEDVHMNVEERLTQITPAGAKLHTARSRNDQVALDLRLWTIDECDALIGSIHKLQATLTARAQEHRAVLLPGITHLQHAQPVHFAHILLAWHDALGRDASRLAECKKRAAISPLGACALAGTSLPIDPQHVARELGLTGVFTNSIDAVSDRDFCAEFSFACALLMVHLSQMAEMLVLWSTPTYGYIDLPDDLCTSSSMMPQKKNPDMIELVRGHAGRTTGAVLELLTTLKSLPLGYNRDLQTTKTPTFTAADTARVSLHALTLAFRKLALRTDRMERDAQDGQMLATDLAEYLVRKGVPFREAHGSVGRLMRHCAENQRDVSKLRLKDLKAFHLGFEKDVLDLLDPRTSTKNRTSPGGTGTEQVHTRLASLQGATRE